MVLKNSSLPGILAARLNCPPNLSEASNKVTLWPLSANVLAQAIPAGPPPTTAHFLAL